MTANETLVAALAQALTQQATDNPLVVVLNELLAKTSTAEPKPKTKRDLVYEAAQGQGYGLAKGGELLVSLDTLQAAARAVRNDTIEFVDAPKTDSNGKRNIEKVVVYKADDQTIALHPLYKLAGS